MQKVKKLLSAFLALVVLCTFVSSVFFILHEADHDCSGENCPICAMAAVCRSFISALCVTAVIFSCSLLCGAFARALRITYVKAGKFTPVSLRVKLLN